MKFKVGFTMSAETLFGLIAKMLPLDDLQVEEVAERLPAAKVEKITQLSGPKNRPKKPPRPRGNRYSKGPILDGGCNKIVMDLLSDGKMHRAYELKSLFEASGYSPSGVGSRLDKLRDANIIHQPEFGFWQIGEAPPKKKVASG
jgi:hypothetical protein